MKTILITFCVFAASVSYAGKWKMTCSKEVVKIDTIIPVEPRPVVEPPYDADEPVRFAEKMAEYPGGDTQMMKDIHANIIYPVFEKENNIQGVVYVQFIVEKDGTLKPENVMVTRGIAGGKNLDKAAVAAVKKLKTFSPAMQNGKPTRLTMTLPIRFTLPKNTEGEKNYSEDMPPPPPMSEPVKGPKTNQSERLEEPVAFAAEMPEYPGGEKAMVEFISANLKYPKEEKDKNIQGVVYVQFVVEKDGSVSEVKTTRNPQESKNFSQEAERVVKLLKFSKPAYQTGKPVRLTMTMPVRFSLNKEEAAPKKP